MQIVSNAFKDAMENRPYLARLTLDGVDIVPYKAVQDIYFRGGANASEEQFALGSAVSSSVEITLDKSMVAYELKGRELLVEFGMELTTGTEWLPMGTYMVETADADDGVLVVKAQDALHAKFDVDYEPLDGFDFATELGVSSTAFLEALCDRRGVTVDLDGLESIPLKNPPDGFTEREIIGFISALYGGFANISRTGVLRICHYTETDAQVTADNYYEDGMEKATYEFTVGWLKCYNELTDLTMFVGNLNADQGIFMESIWMNQSILNRIWETMQGFSYRPVKGVSFLGNPLLDPGDIIMLEDLSGEIVRVLAMTVSHEYDGGLITTVTASGQAKTTNNDGPTKKAVFRSAKRSEENAKNYTDAENEKLNQLELFKRLTKDWVDDGIYLTEEGKIAINASAILVGIIQASLIQTGVLQSKDGKTFVLDLDNNIIKMSSKSGTYDLNITGAEISLKNGHGETFAVSNADDLAYIYFVAYDADGNDVGRSQFGANRIFLGGTWANPAFRVETGRLPDGTTTSKMIVNRINPGKTKLWAGTCATGNTITVPNTSDFDLFAVRLGDDGGTYSQTVLAYKSGSEISGVGGWAGTASKSKDLQFVTFTANGDNWTLEDCGYHYVYSDGNLSERTRVNACEIYGVI